MRSIYSRYPDFIKIPALGLQRLRVVGPAITVELADLFGDAVDPGADVVAFGLDVAQTRVQSSCITDVVDDCRPLTTRQRGLDTLEVRAQESLIDHDT